jgi:hypothetical protein
VDFANPLRTFLGSFFGILGLMGLIGAESIKGKINEMMQINAIVCVKIEGGGTQLFLVLDEPFGKQRLIKKNTKRAKRTKRIRKKEDFAQKSLLFPKGEIKMSKEMISNENRLPIKKG